MKKIFTFILFIIPVLMFAQTSGGVMISPGGGGPDPSAALEINFTNKGFLPPRLSTSQRDSISTPATGLQIYNTTTGCIEFYTGTGGWQPVACPCSSAPATPGTISGPTSVCSNSTYTYWIAPVAGASTYTWAIPTGGTILAGQGTCSVNVSVTSAVFASINVTAGNACGTSSASSQSILLNTSVPATPSTPNASITSVCSGQSVVFTVAAVTGATSYSWSLPSGWNVTSGANTDNITVMSGGSAGTYSISVAAVNCIGTGSGSPGVSVTLAPAHDTLIYTATDSFVMPGCVNSVTVKLWGQGGGGGASSAGGGGGAYMGGTLTVTPGDTYIVIVNAGGGNATSPAGTGGGRSAIQLSGYWVDLVTAGGGGGGGGGTCGGNDAVGGGGGVNASNGENSCGSSSTAGDGATSTSPGSGGTGNCNGGTGSQYQGGNGGCGTTAPGGGAGGGYYGGGGGAGSNTQGGVATDGGAGGGSSYPASSNGYFTLTLARNGSVGGSTGGAAGNNTDPLYEAGAGAGGNPGNNTGGGGLVIVIY